MKVITMHAAKGLQFPVVVVARVNKDSIPLPARDHKSIEEHLLTQRKTFFVACSRAMRRLMIMTEMEKESPFIDGLTDDCWEINK